MKYSNSIRGAQSHYQGVVREAKPLLKECFPPWKNVLGIIENYWT